MKVEVETSEKHQQILTLRLGSIVLYYLCDQFLIQEEDKSLHLVGGCYGTWSAKRGFNRLTNFRMEPLGFLSSKKFLLKGTTGPSQYGIYLFQSRKPLEYSVP